MESAFSPYRRRAEWVQVSPRRIASSPNIHANKLRPGYVLIGDEIFLYERCRRAVLEASVPPDLRDFCLSDIDLAETNIFEALDRAQTPSLMAPFQVLFIRNLKKLYTRGAKKDEFAAIDGYFRSPNPQAVLIFVADHIRIPSDPRRMDMQTRTAMSASARRWATIAASWNWPASKKPMRCAGSSQSEKAAGEARTGRGPRIGRRPRRGHDADRE